MLDLGFSPHSRNGCGEQPLHTAAYAGNAAVVRLLIVPRATRAVCASGRTRLTLRVTLRGSYSDSSRAADEARLCRLKEIRIIRKLESSIA